MTEALPSEHIDPAAANQQPLDPEGLRSRFAGLAGEVFAHYETQRPHDATTIKSSMVQGRTIATQRYPDGTSREVTTDADGTVETNLHMSGAVVDPSGRHIMLQTKQYPDGSETRDMRFLPSARKGPTIYRWSADQQPVGEVRGNVRRQHVESLSSDTEPFKQAAALVDQVGRHWRVLLEHQRSNGSIDNGRATRSLFRALGNLVGRRR